MARIKMVTRTIEATKAEVKVVSISSDEITTITTNVSGIYTDTADPTLLKLIKKQTETEDLKVLKVIALTDASELYGMTEAEFMAKAKVLDKETRKVLETETSTESESEPETEAEPEPKAEAKKSSKKKGAEA